LDTYYSEVAALSVKAGASMVNDISAGNLDENIRNAFEIYAKRVDKNRTFIDFANIKKIMDGEQNKKGHYFIN
jgi:hypothetical protein